MPIIGGRQASVRGLGFQGAGKPNAPTINSVSVVNATTVTINYTLGSSNGAPITNIGITSSPSTSLTFTNTDLDGNVTVTASFALNTSYNFTMTSTNAVGTSNSSNTSSSVSPNLDPSFISTVTGTYGIRSSSIDSSDRIFSKLSPTSVSGSAIAVLDNSGQFQFGRLSSNEFSGWGSQGDIGFDSSGNWYQSGSYGPSNPSAFISKFNSSNTVQWTATMDYGSADDFYDLVVNSAGDCYASGYRYNTGTTNYDAIIAKCNSSGTGQWSKFVTGGAAGFSAADVDLDSSGDLYVAGTLNSGATVSKISSGGSHIWTSRITPPSGTSYGNAVKVDASGNVYLCGYIAATPLEGYLIKLNSSGSTIWKRRLSGGAGVNINISGIDVDSSGNVYVAGYAGTNGLIAKYDSSGVIQWQRYLQGNENVSFYGCRLNSKANLVCFGQMGTRGIMLKIPLTGALTGSYNVDGITYTYAGSSLTDSDPSLTNSSTSISLQNGNSFGSTTFTESSYSPTFTTVTI